MEGRGNLQVKGPTAKAFILKEQLLLPNPQLFSPVMELQHQGMGGRHYPSLLASPPVTTPCKMLDPAAQLCVQGRKTVPLPSRALTEVDGVWGIGWVLTGLVLQV